jgi:uncharacterized surface protein with fasciclin (FAS1) repeats
MERKFWRQFVRQVLFLGTLYLCAVSCKDDYYYDNKEPDWLGASIYDYLKENGKFTYYTRLIDDVGYTEVLKKTGSKTLFVASDSSFEVFFKENGWGVTSYNDLSLAQKRLILNYGMIDNAYLIETLSNYNNGSLVLGQAMRQNTSVAITDSIPFEKGDDLPDGAYWNSKKSKGLYLLKDDSKWPMVYFLQKQLDNAGITPEDFSLIAGFSRNINDAYLFKNKVIVRDITCKNGYVNVLNSVLIPPMNMADYIFKTPDASIFSRLLHRFCSPYYSQIQTTEYKKTHISFNDSLFVKRFYTVSTGGGSQRYPVGTSIDATLLLPFDPGWNGYHYINPQGGEVALQADMAAMFVPTNEAMDAYFNSGKGKILMERYGTWENVPDNIVVLLLKRHMRRSFIESVPSRFNKMNDDENNVVPAQKTDIISTYIGKNGLIYSINKVYGPVDYESVYAPVLFSEKTKIFNWAIIQNEFKLYLNSLVSTYSFLVPTDEYLTKYIDPFTIGKDIPGVLKFWFNNTTGIVNATIYKYDKTTNIVGDSVGVITSSSFIKNRLLELLDSHIIVGNVESGQRFYLTKGGSIIKAEGAGLGLTVEGGGDIDLGQKSHVTKYYGETNGTTYFIDKPIQTPIKSVYNILSTTPEFSEFFNLLNGFPSSSSSTIFLRKTNYYGIDYNIKFFNTFNYTVYVPTNDAIKDAFANGVIIPWVTQNGITGINDMTDATKQNDAILKLERFLRYHFQDNAVFISGNPVTGQYATATIKNDDLPTRFNTFKNKYYKIGIAGDGAGLSLTTEKNGTAKVVTSGGKYNIITRDYIFNADPSSYKEIDGSGSAGTSYVSSLIYTSSTAVIHQIDKVLQFQ